MSDEDNLFMTDEEMDYEDMQEAAKGDWCYSNFGDGDDHGWTQEEIDRYEDQLMSNDPGIHSDGSYYD